MKRLMRQLLFTIATLSLSVHTAHAGPDEDRTIDLYKRFSYTNVTTTEAQAQFHQMGITSGFNPKRTMQNPDPEWLPGWNNLQLTDETQTAILQAAINRTWTAKIHEDYKRYRDAWAAIEKDFRPELERAAALPGYYAPATALAKLLADVRKAAGDKKVLYPAGYQPATV